MSMKTSVRELIGQESGFTLTELLVVASLMVSILGVSFLAFNTVSTLSDRIQAREKASSAATFAIEGMARELRQARALPGGTSAFKTSQAAECTFYVDLDRNGRPYRITYFIQNSKLYRKEAVATKVAPTETDFTGDSAPKLLLAVTSDSIFTYYDNGSYVYSTNSYTPPAAITNAVDVTAVKILIGATARSGPESVSATSSTLVNVRSTNVLMK
jgi:type II secretory pathway component PulJ